VPRPRKGENKVDAVISVRMYQEAYTRLVAAAQADRRKVGEMARVLLEDGLASWERTHHSHDTPASVASTPVTRAAEEPAPYGNSEPE